MRKKRDRGRETDRHTHTDRETDRHTYRQDTDTHIYKAWHT